MSYYESAEGVTINLSRVYQELNSHGCIGADRLYIVAMLNANENGEYDAQELLQRLGY